MLKTRKKSRESSTCVFKIFFIVQEAVRKVYLMSSVMLISSFLECQIYRDKRPATKTTKVKCQFFRSVSYDIQFPGYAKVFL